MHGLLAIALAFIVSRGAHTDPCAFATPTVPTLGLTPASTGARTVYDPDSYGGSDYNRLQTALTAAAAVSGAVVMHRFYELHGPAPTIGANVMLTGGGIRRACSPMQTLTAAVSDPTDNCVTVTDASLYTGVIVYVFSGTAASQNRGAFTIASNSGTQLCNSGDLGFTASIGDVVGETFDLLDISPAYDGGVVIDSVAFDGNSDCNTYTHDWTLNASLSIRGANTVKNSYFYDTPSENIVVCGATLTGNTAWNLGGSFVHKSCADDGAVDTITSNNVNGANLYTDAVMVHSEGVFTFSANAGHDVLRSNKFLNGSEAVFGPYNGDLSVHAIGDCYSGFDVLMSTSTAAQKVDLTQVEINAVLENVPELQRSRVQ